MQKGPKLNDISKNFTTRDSLGIEGVATTMQGEVCPIVNTVTPRAFYWPFMVWIYYDFYMYSGIEERTYKRFDEYLKRQDYFFVLATLLTPGSDRNGLVGIQKSEQDIRNNPDGPYPFNPSYFASDFGGMMYYNAGCLSMYFVTNHRDEDNKELKFPILTKEGKQMAFAFENVIKGTTYYKKYRRNQESVPRSVLIEYGKVIKFNLDGFDECKTILRKHIFEDERKTHLKLRSRLLTECAEYIKLLNNKYGIKIYGRDICRQIFFDHNTPTGKIVVIPDSLNTVSNKWEIIVGRQYFTTGIEMIWKYMLIQLSLPMKGREWISRSIENAEFSIDTSWTIEDILDRCYYSFDEREKMIREVARGTRLGAALENGLLIILSVYNRFTDRKDFEGERAYFAYGTDGHSIPFIEAFGKIDEYRKKSIEEFLYFIMVKWVVDQHYATAFEKMLQKRDGFYFEFVDGYYFKKHEFDMRFQDIRMSSLAQVMKDLDML